MCIQAQDTSQNKAKQIHCHKNISRLTESLDQSLEAGASCGSLINTEGFVQILSLDALKHRADLTVFNHFFHCEEKKICYIKD